MPKFLTVYLSCLALMAPLLLLPSSLQADQTDPRLDQLFDALQLTDDAGLLPAIENNIWQIWFEHPSNEVVNLMEIGVQRMNQNSYAEALLIFSRIIESFPEYAEAWNQRATLYYILGDYPASIEDIGKTLELENRHFGALSGLGMVYLQQNELSKAKQAFEDLLQVHPNSPSASQNLRTVEESLRFSVI